uniref:Uncharacterized protein n=1 Tax=Arundo donax TaxID=35708 RepID=A0A0A9CBC5_ARUDO
MIPTEKILNPNPCSDAKHRCLDRTKLGPAQAS